VTGAATDERTTGTSTDGVAVTGAGVVVIGVSFCSTSITISSMEPEPGTGTREDGADGAPVTFSVIGVGRFCSASVVIASVAGDGRVGTTGTVTDGVTVTEDACAVEEDGTVFSAAVTEGGCCGGDMVVIKTVTQRERERDNRKGRF